MSASTLYIDYLNAEYLNHINTQYINCIDLADWPLGLNISDPNTLYILYEYHVYDAITLYIIYEYHTYQLKIHTLADVCDASERQRYQGGQNQRAPAPALLQVGGDRDLLICA